ncbi:MAG: hypothetical protein Q9226_007009, partial [Calogaya cf. arnoldii]
LLYPSQKKDARVLSIIRRPMKKSFEEFFIWKARKATNPRQRELIDQSYAVIVDNFWSIDDIKAMADTSSRIYELAMEAGIPDGMARAFKKELKAFKQPYREARHLVDMQAGGGGDPDA